MSVYYDLTRIGVSSLMAYQSALGVASENISNANEPFYSRRQVVFSENLAGHGVNVSDIRRIYDEQANRFVQTAGTDFAKASYYADQLKNFEPMLGDSTTNIGNFVGDALNALQDLSHDASSTMNRSVYLSKLDTVVKRFQNLSSQIGAMQSNSNSSLQVGLGEASQIINNISRLNQQIFSSSGIDISGLLDQREAQMQQLGQYINFSSSVDSFGMVSLTMSNGLSLLSGDQPAHFTTTVDPSNPANLKIFVVNGPNTSDVTNQIANGKLAGIRDFKNNVLDQTQRALGRISLALAQSFNAQNKLGVDGNGALGGNIFNDINSATAQSSRVIANTKNAGSSVMSVNISNLNQLTTSDYTLVMGASNSYSLRRISDNAVVSSGTIGSFPQAISADGFTINVSSGTFTAGDQYLITPTKDAVSGMSVVMADPAKLALGFPVDATSSTSNAGNGSISVKSIVDTSNSAFSVAGQLSPPVQVKFLTATSYQLINANDLSVMEGPITYDPAVGANLFPSPGGYDPGYRVSISGTVAAGDVFNIAYNSNGSADFRNGEVMTQLYKNATLQSGTLNFNQAYNLISYDISEKTQQAKIDFDSKNTINTQASARRDAISGVSVEEETLDLARFQQAYQSSAQILQTAKSVFEMIIGITRG